MAPSTEHKESFAVKEDGASSELPMEALRALAGVVVPRVRGFIKTIVDIASGDDPDADLSMAVLAISELLSAGAHLAAVTDIVPPKLYEPPLMSEVDLEPLRVALHQRFGDLDEYPDVIDPVQGEEMEAAELSADIATIIENLTHGLQHYDNGHQIEALWWWQYSYISIWGERAAAVLRVLQMMLMHVRLDVPEALESESALEDSDALEPSGTSNVTGAPDTLND